MQLRSQFLNAALVFAVPFSAMANAADLREAVPNDTFLAAWHQHNPERDYQSQYYQDIWDTVQETQIADKVMTVIERRMSERDLQKFQEVRRTLETALEPIQWNALVNCTESVYAQKMEIPTSQHLLMLRFGDDGAAAKSLVAGITNLMKLAEQAAQGNIRVETQTLAGTEITVMVLPPQAPFQPVLGVVDENVFVFSTSRQMLRGSLELLKNPSAESKFDDPRLAEALTHVPAVEDGVTFFDGRRLFEQLGGLPAFINQVSGGNAEAARVSAVLQEAFEQFNGIDYEVTVEYTQDYQNRSAAIGKLLPGVDNKVIGKMFKDQESFEHWDRWVPASATSYSLNSGATLHPLYAWVMETIPKHFPEAQQGLDKWAAIQDQYDIHLDEDFLQGFSGETVSINMPGTTRSAFGEVGQSVVYCRCDKPDRIRALIHRGIEALQQIPQVQQQGLALKPVDGMDGFEELSLNMLPMLGIRPVIGFQDGWFVVATHAQAVQTVEETRSGSGESIRGTEKFTQFDLQVDGPVRSIGYTNIGQQTREIGAALQKVGAMLPMVIGMTGASAYAPELAAVSDILALLPSVGQIVAKFDFMEGRLTATVPGPTDDTYIRHTVVTIRPPSEGDRVPAERTQ
ncbi:MAG: hypothetical protein R3C19_18985 [Planctomycetaceae bacterium]